MADKGPLAVREEEILQFWQDNTIFEKSLTKPAPKGEFVFYDGPPFATGLPHTGSLLSSVIKDVVPRYKTMQGYHVARRWGWDCHGLPVESEVEKSLELKTKKDILTVGIDVFNETARAMVLRYVGEWEKYITRVGRWVDFKNSYKTMDNSYIESVWWALSELNKKKLLYEGRKVLMYCPHCETPLAKAEIAMDNTYKEVTEDALVVKFKIKNPKKHNLPDNSYFLAWTTTPWTLPGNAALAVGKDVEYGITEKNGEHHISVAASGSLFGKDLIGIEYEPLFEVAGIQSARSYRVYAGDFVSTEEGTGIVHVAPMYGEDDFALGQKEKLPMVQLLTASGSYNNDAPEFVRGMYFKKGGKEITAQLEGRGLVFEKEAHTHSYPHCYRCGNALIYNAVASWFINIQKVKQKMLSENEKITWVPGHLKEGRFKHIVENAPDWTISRNRFWASPLPIWKEKGGEGLIVISSIDELLQKTKKSGNRYFVMRHGLAQNNIEEIVDSGDKEPYHLVDKGRDQVHEAALGLKNKGIDLIITSPVPRTRETAAIVQKELGLPDSAVMVDERITEVQVGVYSGRPVAEYKDAIPLSERFERAPEGGENYLDIRRRVGDFLFEIERRYSGKNILIVGHVRSVWLLKAIAALRTNVELIEEEKAEQPIQNGVAEEFSFSPFPHNKNFELDLHRPYIDVVELVDGEGGTYERVPEVIDCWVESGAMPFASAGYPKNTSVVNPKRLFGFSPLGYPADFIAEYIAQTRTWFYYMHAMGVLLFNQLSFKAVVSTGTILASDGSKMSKSKKNYTDPYTIMDQYGADALRLYLMGSVVMQSEDLNFRDEDVREAGKTLSTLQNCLQFFELYKKDLNSGVLAAQSPSILDQWILARLADVGGQVTTAMDGYDMPTVCRQIKQFVDDYSTWYVRRSRDRMKMDGEDKQYGLATQKHVLEMLSKLMAPITPFIAEHVYRTVADGESVHLSLWPVVSNVSEAQKKLVTDMVSVRKAVSVALQAREKAGLKVRQPLSKLTAKRLPEDESLRALIADEVNVKVIFEDTNQTEEVVLDTNLTPELTSEGWLREAVRMIQDFRKTSGLTIDARPILEIRTTVEGQKFVEEWKTEMMRRAGLSDVRLGTKPESEPKELPFPFEITLH